MNTLFRRHAKMLATLTLSIAVVFSGCTQISALITPPEKVDKSAKVETQQNVVLTPDLNVVAENEKAADFPNEPAVAVMAEQKPINIGDDLPVSRALVAKMLSTTFNDLATIDANEREITFTDTQSDKWYDKYINAAYIGGFMQGSDGKFMPEQAITLSQAQVLFDKLDPNNKVKLKLTDATKDNPISYALWVDLYKKLLVNLSGNKTINEVYNVESDTFIVLATPKNNDKLKAFNMITDKGPISYAGLNMDIYVDKEISVLKKDNEVIAITAVTSQTPTILNAFIVKNDGQSVTVFSGGVERNYTTDKQLGDVKNKICDVTISDGNALNIIVYSEQIDGVVKKSTDKNIELDAKGIVQLAEQFKVYSVVDGGVKWKSANDLIVGQNMAHFILRDGKIGAAIITKKFVGENIRVAISTTGFKGLLHDKVTIISGGKFVLTAAGKKTEFAAGTALNVDKSAFNGASRIYIAPVAKDGKLEISSIKRAWEGNKSPSYRGIMEVSIEDGGYYIVNELPLEQYLYSVVPSEMPSGHGVEASKVQAVTARSYARNQLFANRYHKYGANVDDSVSCQVYNNISENQTSIKAVDETNGQCLTFEGAPISANFFSTSSGMTANSGEVWANSESKGFPAYTEKYLQASKQYTSDVDYGDLSKEENAAKFFKNVDIKGYDSTFGWFRWNVTMSAKEISNAINSAIKGRYQANSGLIKTLQADGAFRSRPIETIGDLKDLQITKRGGGGNIMEMKVVGTKATVLIITEYNVRALIKPVQTEKGAKAIVLNKKDGTKSENYSIMPSAFYTFDKKLNADGSLAQVTFFGGGNGHGVGMSQNGVKGMIDAGKTFDEILKHYYKGTEIKIVK